MQTGSQRMTFFTNYDTTGAPAFDTVYTDIYKRWFFPQIIKDWNVLSDSFIFSSTIGIGTNRFPIHALRYNCRSCLIKFVLNSWYFAGVLSTWCLNIVCIFSKTILFVNASFDSVKYKRRLYGNEPHRDKTNEMACAPSEDSDQPGHPPSLIRVFVVHLMGS